MTEPSREAHGLPLARDLAWQLLVQADLASVADAAGAALDRSGGRLCLPYLRLSVEIVPEARGIAAQPETLTLMEEVLILRYLTLCRGTPPSGRWLSFRDLPGGMQYFGPFFGRTGRPLAARFGADLEAFERVASYLGGDPLAFGDRSFLFRLLPKFWLGLVLHGGDEEFAAEASILFDSTLREQYTTEDCAAAAQVLVRRLLEAVPQPPNSQH